MKIKLNKKTTTAKTGKEKAKRAKAAYISYSDIDMNTKKLYIGLDLSLKNTGIAISTSDNIFTKTLTVPTEKDNFTSSIHRMIYIRNVIHTMLTSFKNIYPEHESVCCLEWYAFGGTSIVKLAELGGIVRALMIDLKIPYCDVTPSALKKFITKKGKSEKEEMKQRMAILTNMVYETDDEADAMACVLYLKEEVKKISTYEEEE